MKHNVDDKLTPLLCPVGRFFNSPDNERLHTPSDIEILKASLNRHQQYSPIKVNQHGEILAGNGVFTAACELGWTHIAAIELDRDESGSAAIRLVDNKSAENSEFDLEAVQASLEELIEAGYRPIDLGFLEQSAMPLSEEDSEMHDFQPAMEEEQGRLDRKAPITCPECGHEFTP